MIHCGSGLCDSCSSTNRELSRYVEMYIAFIGSRSIIVYLKLMIKSCFANYTNTTQIFNNVSR